MKVLTIAPWYPSEGDQMAGLFVKNFVDETTKSGACHEVFCRGSISSILGGLIHYSKRENRPEVVHLHVVTKQGLIALFLRRLYDIPYIITEHWSGYYPENGSFSKLANRPLVGRLYLWYMKKVFGGAALVTGVSEQLLGRLRELGLTERGEVLYNIVPDFFAKEDIVVMHGSASIQDEKRVSEPVPLTQIINVSCFDNSAKNLTGIIDAIKIIKDKDFTFTFIGDGKDKEMVEKYAHEQGVDEKIRFTGEIEPREVARWMQEAWCLVLNSNYETACVVLQEALSTGLPIISTPVGIAPEFPEHIETVEAGNSKMLAEAMARFIERPKERYEGVRDFKDVPNKLYSIYETLLSGR